MLTGQYQRSLDSKIRVTLPATQRKELSLKRDVTIVGNGDHIEIWDTKKWDDYFNADSGVEALENLIFGM